MRRIGITGGIACGKSEVVAQLRKLGAAVTDADEISRALTAEGGEALRDIMRVFGLSYFDGEGRLNRRKLGQTVFVNASSRKKLEDIIHPLVKAQMEAELAAFAAEGRAIAFLDIPLLYEAGMEGMCDAVWVVTAPYSVQLDRLIKRDGLTRREANDRIRSQMPAGQKAALADVVIRNEGSVAALAAQVTRLYNELSRDGQPPGKDAQ